MNRLLLLSCIAILSCNTEKELTKLDTSYLQHSDYNVTIRVTNDTCDPSGNGEEYPDQSWSIYQVGENEYILLRDAHDGRSWLYKGSIVDNKLVFFRSIDVEDYCLYHMETTVSFSEVNQNLVGTFMIKYNDCREVYCDVSATLSGEIVNN